MTAGQAFEAWAALNLRQARDEATYASFLAGFSAGEAAAQRPIPVTERMPDINQVVLVAIKGQQFWHVGKYVRAYEGAGIWWALGHGDTRHVYAWLPLPAAPERT